MKDFLYLDYNATTPADLRVIEAMMPFFAEIYGNAGSSHLFGLTVKEAVEQAGEQIASLISSKPKDIIYTSGATEAINLALKGIQKMEGKNQIITLKTEHKAVLDTCNSPEMSDFEIKYLSVNPDGLIDIEELKNTIGTKTSMVCLMYVNNETGVIQRMKEITEMAHAKGCLVFCDATQAVGKIPVNVEDLGFDMMAFSAHKFYGPKGIGALYVSQETRKNIRPQIHGGGQQFNLRSGTLNVPGIIGMGKAAEIASQEMEQDRTRIEELRDYLEYLILQIPNTHVNGDKINRIYNTSNICFSGVNSEQLIISLGNISVSSGSACNATTSQPSHVLKAMGIAGSEALSSIRFSLGRYTDKAEIELAAAKIKTIVLRMRQAHM